MPKQNESIPVGLIKSLQLRVDERLTVPALPAAFARFSDMPPVFATAFMVAFIESVCIEAIADHLDPGQKTVGTHIDVSHVSATPIGMLVQAEVEVVAVTGRTLRFRVRCSDAGGLIGEGFHERAIVDMAKFMVRVAEKSEKRVV
jgi:fluoroacetyl-CoA thioesterase